MNSNLTAGTRDARTSVKVGATGQLRRAIVVEREATKAAAASDQIGPESGTTTSLAPARNAQLFFRLVVLTQRRSLGGNCKSRARALRASVSPSFSSRVGLVLTSSGAARTGRHQELAGRCAAGVSGHQIATAMRTASEK
ncbi:hypothetical protein K438DRAFT_1813889 [Mycena galopus ATCC 62051]|nr:hypothetical protein K438DRAFT_1813889 [Mycena galopus ATCC 62051]